MSGYLLHLKVSPTQIVKTKIMTRAWLADKQEWEVWAKDNKSKDDERQVNNRKCGAKKIYAGKTSRENEQK